MISERLSESSVDDQPRDAWPVTALLRSHHALLRTRTADRDLRKGTDFYPVLLLQSADLGSCSAYSEAGPQVEFVLQFLLLLMDALEAEGKVTRQMHAG